ncbi:N-acetylglucosaminyldiphosphodolichol N-acetylglucosaminyltransferase catalytic subunit alg13 [Coemansia sp. RSA 1813]|nr:N-acetylglucosaminyldiphosphodolichol N-acetylglucosaminyltransferase catalytic subunit alg13 [Coemansia sp. RSA 1646]KAJ1773289.1 N-acetylglucosaminyldiphosphodolichol N-acetylglucosaminyltransferase catalytic subunit alg13 [Coemansia sp. RSA 1843]KAJ2092757.1 N-acetylglucosaminyldiphosphodolichol N-acetylglucosaminyltransferase catalytic subunit alg13 [Coemansia sp. RSA 986]KAJ2217744.1 N-acetylglucosaminyldiphosphodolichol N-acetylglucosaminyltransferase catalytic subunit alg13 [Coemansia 
MSVFVTVGSTGFDDLISAINTRRFMQSLRSRGLRSLVVQYGTSEQFFGLPNASSAEIGISVTAFDYASGTQKFVDRADLVISHAGAGSILDALHSHRPLIVVVNRRLMDDHQNEIALELSRAGYLVVSSPEDLADTVANGSFMGLQPYPHADPRPIGEIIEAETLLQK